MKYTIGLLILLAVACAKPKEITASLQTMQEENKRYNFQADYPTFEIEALDSVVIGVVDSYYDRCRKETAEQEHEEWFRPFEVKIIGENEVVNNRYVSVGLLCYYYAGGAHGMTFNYTYTYDVKEGQLLTIADLISDNPDELVYLVKEKLKAQIGECNWVVKGVEGLESLSKFIITDTAVEFIFNPYEVAAYAYGVQKVSITNEEYSFNIER
ncbi:MAG: DUF3298 domain-containing protein [Mangrovibacterium sp.]